MQDNRIVDAEEILAKNIKEESKVLPPIIASKDIIDIAEVTEESVAEELLMMGDESGMSVTENEEEIVTENEEEAK
jgi:hypothetical protein